MLTTAHSFTLDELASLTGTADPAELAYLDAGPTDVDHDEALDVDTHPAAQPMGLMAAATRRSSGGVWLLDLPDVLRGAGCDVVEVADWRTRGVVQKGKRQGLARMNGLVAHHTGCPDSVKGDMPSLQTLVKGRPDVPGPLSQTGLGRSGRWYVVAAGKCWHAGAVLDSAWSSSFCLGTECESAGTSGGRQIVGDQYAAYVLGFAAMTVAYAPAAGKSWFIKGHKEIAKPKGRKIDPLFDMGQFRADVAAKVAELTQPKQPAMPAKPKYDLDKLPLVPITDERIERGDRGEQVARVQLRLSQVGLLAIAGVDGIFGSNTRAAVEAFQRQHGLKADGVVNPVTRQAMGLHRTYPAAA